MTGKIFTFGAAALALSLSGAAYAADVPARVVTKAPAPVAEPTPIWDIAFGGLVASDYYFRGISQSNRGPSAGAYVEAQYNSGFGQWYLGLAGWSISWPSTMGFSDPNLEMNFTGGWRHEWGKYSADIGVIYYYYPKEQFNVDSDFFEIYWKGAYEINDKAKVGAYVAYTPDMLNYGNLGALGFNANARGLAAAINASFTYWEQGDWTATISGEFGHWWIKDTGFINFGIVNALPISDPSYSFWNAGVAFAYKAITLDLRYHGNDLGDSGCGSFLLVGTPHPSNRWCGDAFIATLKFDTSLSALK